MLKRKKIIIPHIRSAIEINSFGQNIWQLSYITSFYMFRWNCFFFFFFIFALCFTAYLMALSEWQLFTYTLLLHIADCSSACLLSTVHT